MIIIYECLAGKINKFLTKTYMLCLQFQTLLAGLLLPMVSISICHLNWTPSQLYLSDCYLPFSRIVLKIDCVWLSYEVVNVPKQHGQHEVVQICSDFGKKCSDIEKNFEIWDWRQIICEIFVITKTIWPHIHKKRRHKGCNVNYVLERGTL